MKYKSFDDWFYEIENYSLRAERFWEESGMADASFAANLEKWLKAAYEAGYEAGYIQSKEDTY